MTTGGTGGRLTVCRARRSPPRSARPRTPAERFAQAIHGPTDTAARAKPFEGALAVAKFMRSLSKPARSKRALAGGSPEVHVTTANGGPAVVAVVDGRVVGIMCLEVTADAIAARLTGGKLPNTPIRYVNQCVSLGRGEGLIQYVTADDRAVNAALTGRLAALCKEVVCKGAAWGVANPTLGLPVRRRRVVRGATRTGPAVEASA